jgi:hypothetical protein
MFGFLEKRPHPGPHHRVIVHNQYPHLISLSLLPYHFFLSRSCLPRSRRQVANGWAPRDLAHRLSSNGRSETERLPETAGSRCASWGRPTPDYSLKKYTANPTLTKPGDTRTAAHFNAQPAGQ